MREPIHYDAPPRERQIFCNRTLNLRQVKAVGYDMDYTLIHYKVEVWERRAYEYARKKLLGHNWPVETLQFEPEMMIRGLIVDSQLGNILKVNSFGYVKQAFHGTRPLDFEDQRRVYSRVVVSLSDRRFVFMNTLFSLSEACLYAQLVDLLDAQKLPNALGYAEVYRKVRASIDEAHVEGQLKDEIMAHPDRFVVPDPETPLALLDQRHAGKKLMLITNSEWSYTRAMMNYVFDRFLPKGTTWRDLFNIIIVAARKPAFFELRSPLFDVVSEDGLLRPNAGGMREGGIYTGGDAAAVEAALGLEGDQILYVGDHIYGDVNVSKQLLRWRTALVLRELEQDLTALDAFEPSQQKLSSLMQEKEGLEFTMSHLRLQLQRKRHKYTDVPSQSDAALQEALQTARTKTVQLDEAIRPLAETAAKLGNANWGPLMRSGNDKSHLARQVERYADIYMSRVSNFAQVTPYAYLRSMRGSLPHDPTAGPSLEKAGTDT